MKTAWKILAWIASVVVAVFIATAGRDHERVQVRVLNDQIAGLKLDLEGLRMDVEESHRRIGLLVANSVDLNLGLSSLASATSNIYAILAEQATNRVIHGATPARAIPAPSASNRLR